jgi:glycosyltransferase involved in cell wall biosynthesis
VNRAVSVIVPAYNEEDAIVHTVEELRSVLGSGVEILVVDDGSTDSTAQLVSAMEGVRLVRQVPNQGKGAAMRAGAEAATGDAIVFTDADLTYPAADTAKVIEMLERHDAVFTERAARAIPLFNQLGNRGFSGVITYAFGFRGRDPLSGLYGLTKRHFKYMDLQSNRFSIESEICVKTAVLGLDYDVIAIDYRDRVGDSKLHPIKAGWDILKELVLLGLRFRPQWTLLAPALVVLVLAALPLGIATPMRTVLAVVAAALLVGYALSYRRLKDFRAAFAG